MKKRCIGVNDEDVNYVLGKAFHSRGENEIGEKNVCEAVCNNCHVSSTI